MAEPAEEKVLLGRSAEGEREAYATLYTRYLGMLYQYIYLFTGSRENSEEIVQDVFVRIWERKSCLARVNDFKAYLFRTARNLLTDHARRQQTAFRVQARVLRPVSAEASEQADLPLICNQYEQIARDAIGLLPCKRKQIFELRTRDELSLDEIARKMAISKSVVKKQLYAATGFVKEYLRKHGEITIGLLLFFLF